MRFAALLALSLVLAPPGAIAQQAPVTRAPFIVERTYWIKPGKELQFIDLFEKHQVPLLQAKVKEGDVLWMRLSRPQFNTTNDQWDLRITIAWRDADSAIERISRAKEQASRDAQRGAMERQIMDELVLERSDVPVQEWSAEGGGP